MRETMIAFFTNQLDFIFFFYGLAFILLGATCFAVARSESQGEAWAFLGLFGFAHGIGEWLDLTALILADSAPFAVARIALMIVSFVLLLEFGRLEAVRFGMKLPGRWIYAPAVLLIVGAGIASNLAMAGAIARYMLGFGGALAACLVFVGHARISSGSGRRFAIFAAVGWALYAVAAGLVVPSAPFWPANTFSYTWFAELTGMPIQLVRGFIACWISFAVWAIWGSRLAIEVSSARYSIYLRRQFIWTLVAMAAILGGGWTLTQFLGGIYRLNVENASRGDIDLLASRLTGETATIEGMVKSLAGSSAAMRLLGGGSQRDSENAKSILDLDVEASGAKQGYILDKSGIVVASSGSKEHPSRGQDYSASTYFQKSIAGAADYRFGYDAASRSRDYYASQPIRSANGKIVGVAVLMKSLDVFEKDLKEFDRPYFFVDADGVVVMTNMRASLFRTLWPLAAQKQSELSQHYGERLDGQPMLKSEIVDATWTSVDGERNYVRRRFANHSQWSLVILKPSREIFASRVMGIIVTLLVTIMTLIYLLGRERWVHDNVQMERRLSLQELARNLSFQATTDALTGLSNRLKFDQTLIDEMLRSDRYRTPLSLVMYDVDHFKEVNDAYGHQIGDHVLTQLSKVVKNLIRSSDLLARWGGEEFAILVPGSGAEMVFQASEKLRGAIEQAVFDGVGTVTCSFGVTQYTPGETAAAFISRADDALYRAKINGRNQVQLVVQPANARLELVSVA